MCQLLRPTGISFALILWNIPLNQNKSTNLGLSCQLMSFQMLLRYFVWWQISSQCCNGWNFEKILNAIYDTRATTTKSQPQYQLSWIQLLDWCSIQEDIIWDSKHNSQNCISYWNTLLTIHWGLYYKISKIIGVITKTFTAEWILRILPAQIVSSC
jgi:hypothetical protein